MINKRTLIKWRKEALYVQDKMAKEPKFTFSYDFVDQILNRILLMTQELYDIQLMEDK